MEHKTLEIESMSLLHKRRIKIVLFIISYSSCVSYVLVYSYPQVFFSFRISYRESVKFKLIIDAEKYNK